MTTMKMQNGRQKRTMRAASFGSGLRRPGPMNARISPPEGDSRAKPENGIFGRERDNKRHARTPRLFWVLCCQLSTRTQT
ncbi:hypothetical protein RJ641_000684 [Dillenia turbinata]|uniref:Uncharacterized protein n=1 Tax=Dillenia turbinata TaxID=194707 RepID=A0AAN8WEF6_9MAGN